MKARGIDVRTYQNVLRAWRDQDAFELLAESHVGIQMHYRAQAVVLAFRRLRRAERAGRAGRGAAPVSHFYDEPERDHARDVLIVGGKGSASEAALQIWRAGGRVTMSYRRPQFSGLKYWIQPDLENRIKDGAIRAFLPSVVKEIRPELTVLELGDGHLEAVPADFVLALTGYQPKLDLFDQLGVSYDPLSKRPRVDKRTYESNVPGVTWPAASAPGTSATRSSSRTGACRCRDCEAPGVAAAGLAQPPVPTAPRPPGSDWLLAGRARYDESRA